ncbi:hypothetical protein [Methylocystis heyeri]|uniref:Uncharacterized protein n=1 Tax=Methylocystis heyeri TaxID=391905 RepID=A0A6B8KEJ2_9HYPH|nr:hypothetical protein [Methylocystis heyeri]QGM44998.1 hypothetical protein H2LOC_004455 [Methylocystis heyeri]
MTTDKTERSTAELDSWVGRWVCVDQWNHNIVIAISKTDDGLDVQAFDPNDGEVAEIYDPRLVGDVFLFSAHWSTGQFTKYRVRQLGDELEIIFTYTDATHYKRDLSHQH